MDFDYIERPGSDVFRVQYFGDNLSTLDNANCNASRWPKWNGWNRPINKPFIQNRGNFFLKNYHKESKLVKIWIF